MRRAFPLGRSLHPSSVSTHSVSVVSRRHHTAHATRCRAHRRSGSFGCGSPATDGTRGRNARTAAHAGGAPRRAGRACKASDTWGDPPGEMQSFGSAVDKSARPGHTAGSRRRSAHLKDLRMPKSATPPGSLLRPGLRAPWRCPRRPSSRCASRGWCWPARSRAARSIRSPRSTWPTICWPSARPAAGARPRWPGTPTWSSRPKWGAPSCCRPPRRTRSHRRRPPAGSARPMWPPCCAISAPARTAPMQLITTVLRSLVAVALGQGQFLARQAALARSTLAPSHRAPGSGGDADPRPGRGHRPRRGPHLHGPAAGLHHDRPADQPGAAPSGAGRPELAAGRRPPTDTAVPARSRA